MAKDDKGGASGKDKKGALKSAQSLLDDSAELRDLHAQLGKQLDAYDKNVDALKASIEKDNQAETQKRFKLQQDLQDNIFSIQQDITKNKMKAADKAMKAMANYIKS